MIAITDKEGGNALLAGFMGYVYVPKGIFLHSSMSGFRGTSPDGGKGWVSKEQAEILATPANIDDFYEGKYPYKDAVTLMLENVVTAPLYLIAISNRTTKLDFKRKLKFDTDWNELHAVIEKIESVSVRIKDENDNPDIIYRFTVEINGSQAAIDREILHYDTIETDFLKTYDCNTTNKKESVWLALVRFVEWFNENNS